jgi:glycosyltransferase involved in cell wall biosynthesis
MTPSVSCLCISEKRPLFLKKTINQFINQTYPNKELIILSRKFDPNYESIVSKHKKEHKITYLWIDTLFDLTLGDLRNHAIEKSNGDYWCVWDDDDWHHNKRIEIQMKEMLLNAKDGTALTHTILFDKKKKIAYLSFQSIFSFSIMCKKSRVNANLKYPSINRGEDMAFLQMAYNQNILFPLVKPMLYIYICHTGNSMSRAHFEYFFSLSNQLSPRASKMIFDIVCNKIPYNKASVMLENQKFLRELNYFRSNSLGSFK